MRISDLETPITLVVVIVHRSGVEGYEEFICLSQFSHTNIIFTELVLMEKLLIKGSFLRSLERALNFGSR